MTIKSIAKACGKDIKQVREAFKIEGDLGIVVYRSKNSMKTLTGFFSKNKTSQKSLTFDQVFKEI